MIPVRKKGDQSIGNSVCNENIERETPVVLRRRSWPPGIRSVNYRAGWKPAPTLDYRRRRALGGLNPVEIQDHGGEIQYPQPRLNLLPVSHHQYLHLVGTNQLLGDAVHIVQGYSFDAGTDGL